MEKIMKQIFAALFVIYTGSANADSAAISPRWLTD